jgi:hypothetical protein
MHSQIGEGNDLQKQSRKQLIGWIASALGLAAAGAFALVPAGADAAVARPMPPTPPATVYAITFTGNSALYALDPKRHKETLKGYTGTQLTDISFRGRSLYAVSFTGLYSLNPFTGVSHYIGSLGLSGANALATQPWTNKLYGADANGDLFWVDPRTGHATLIGNFGPGLGSAGDLAFAGGILYATVTKTGSSDTYLAVVNALTGAARIIGDTHYTDVYGLVTGAGALYGATYGGSFLRISPFTGNAQPIWNEGLPIGGLAAP